MPTRFATAVIILVWFGTLAWLGYHDVWPRLRTGDPPSYVVNIQDEERSQRTVRWVVYRDTEPKKPRDPSITNFTAAATVVLPNPPLAAASCSTFFSTGPFGTLSTSVAYSEPDDCFILESMFKQREPSRLFGIEARILQLTHQERVTRDGDLREVVVDLEAMVEEVKAKLRLDGVVRDGQLHAKVRFNDEDFPVDAVPVTRRSGMLLAMHPINQIAGLQAGQRWHVSLVDPLRDLFAAVIRKQLGGFSLGAESGSATLSAEVLAEPKLLEWFGRRDVCWVIEYRGGDDTAHTWVRQSDGLVLRQEARRGGEVLILQRRPDAAP